MKYRKYLFLICLFLLSSFCIPKGVALAENLEITFRHAGESFAVPVDLLKAIGYVESRWSQRNGEPSIDGAYGIMCLRENGNCQTLIEASEETSFSLEALKTDYVANIVGCAAVLKRYADEEVEKTGKRPNSAVESWSNVLRRYCGIKDDAVAQMYVHEIYEILQNGTEGVTEDGEIIIINKREIDFQETREVSILPKSPDYPPAQWVPACSSNYTTSSRPSTFNIDTVVIHVAQGSYTGTISWFQNCSSQVSAHYVIRSSDGQITQMVLEKDIAWHAGNLNYNTRSIGIEHEGFVSNCSFFTDAMYRASAALVRNICNKYGIPKDRTHIIGHNEVPGATHTDPGPCWDWNKFMQLVNVGPPPCTSTKFNIGDCVQVTGTGGIGLRVRANPSLNATILCTAPDGSTGRVVESCQTADGFNWWKITWDSGSCSGITGWSAEDWLGKIICPCTSRKFNIGDCAQVTGTGGIGLRVRDNPNLSGNVLCTAPDGSRGKVIASCQIADGFNWWKITWDSGTCGGITGWSAEDWIVKVTCCLPLPEVCDGIDNDCDGLIDEGVNCDDGNPCTIDSCVNGQCVHQPNPNCCDDGNPCTIDSFVNGQCVHQPINCDDGNPCTIDSCVNGQCVHQPNPNCCDDGNPCTIDSFVNGQCVHQPINCDDGNPCTIDSCVNGQCVHQPNPNCCDDGNPCTIDSFVNGQCVHQPINCDDGNPCTIDSCVNGQCVHQPNPNCCDDGNPCTIDSFVNGQCVHQPINCDDGNPCTIDSCVNGQCVHQPTGNPKLSTSPRSLTFSLKQGQNTCKPLFVWRRGCGTLQWQVSEPCTWLTLQPTSGDSTGEKDTVNVCVDTAGLRPGIHRCTISVSSNGGNKTIPVTLRVRR